MEERRHNDEAIIAELRGMRELFNNKIDTIMVTTNRIEEQTTKTNGRVTKLEQEVQILKIINAEETGEKKAMKPYQTVLLSVVGSILAAIGINWAIK